MQDAGAFHRERNGREIVGGKGLHARVLVLFYARIGETKVNRYLIMILAGACTCVCSPSANPPPLSTEAKQASPA